MFANTSSRRRDRNERNELISNWNESAREAFLKGEVPTLLKAVISRGKRVYKHAHYSDWLNSGFRIYVFLGRQPSKEELKNIGETVLSDSMLIRKLVVLGFDTLEVCGDDGDFGCRWQLKDRETRREESKELEDYKNTVNSDPLANNPERSEVLGIETNDKLE